MENDWKRKAEIREMLTIDLKAVVSDRKLSEIYFGR